MVCNDLQTKGLLEGFRGENGAIFVTMCKQRSYGRKMPEGVNTIEWSGIGRKALRGLGPRKASRKARGELGRLGESG
jgi:hypothetical protein